MDQIQNEPATTTTTTPLAIEEEEEPNKVLSKSQYSYYNLPQLISPTLLFLLLLLPLLHYTYVNFDTQTLITHHLSSRSSVDHTPHHHHHRRRRRYRGCDNVVDFSSGEWVPNPDRPRYTNESCGVIHDHQNCMRNGRPDLGFTTWKWQPSGGGGGRCDLVAGFDPLEFLETVRGKSMAFVGDSIVRNQVQSLICLLSKVEYPLDVSTNNNNSDFFNFPRWIYKTHNFTLSSFWSPYLVHSTQDKPRHSKDYGRINLHLDDPDPSWSTTIDDFDYLILGAGHWFTRPLNYHTHNTPLGCTYYCEATDPRNLTVVYPTSYGYRRAFHTAFAAILARQRFKGTVFLRTFAPAHFEGGEWDAGGDCARVRPWRSDEVELEGQDKEFYVGQVEEFNLAREEGGRRGVEFVLIDVTKAMLLRPDGHPSKYWRDREDNTTVTSLMNDCVHWCLPGPVDYWNYFLLEMMRRLERKRRDSASNRPRVNVAQDST